MMNTDNIRKLASIIEEAGPRRFDMRSYFGEGNSPVPTFMVRPKEFLNDCGTAACVAGWAAMTSAVERGQKRVVDTVWTASDWLGINDATARKLFVPRGFDDGRCPKGMLYTYRRAASVLRWLAETGDVGWDLFDEAGAFIGQRAEVVR